MGFLKQRNLFKISLLVTLLFISLTAQPGCAIRPWQGEQLFRKIVPDFESLQKGVPVPPSAGNPCTGISGGSGHCVNEMNAAGHLLRSPPAFPEINVIKFAGTTSMESNSNN
ncbi:hypothetical protein PTKIN_Ptkin10aG0045000 [Pterospermum kingtungense]